jgi:hypothetical protein
MPKKKTFDLHIEIGEESDTNTPGKWYAMVVLGPKNTKVECQALTISDAARDLIRDLDNNGLIRQLMSHTSTSKFPLGASSSTGKKQRAIDLLNIPSPDCEPMCLTFEHFGKAKCKNTCGHKNI